MAGDREPLVNGVTPGLHAVDTGRAMATPPPGHLRVLVASDQALIADAVRAALASRGHDALVVRWPGGPRIPSRRRPAADGATQVGLLLSDLDRWSRIRAATLVVEQI